MQSDWFDKMEANEPCVSDIAKCQVKHLGSKNVGQFCGLNKLSLAVQTLRSTVSAGSYLNRSL